MDFFPAVPFEAAVLSQLREVPASENGGETDPTNRVEELMARKEELEALVVTWKSRMDNIAIVETVTAKLGEYAAELSRVTSDLAVAELEAASPMTDAWGDFLSLADRLNRDNSNVMRMRVKAGIRRVVKRLVCAFLYQSRKSVAVVRVEFGGGGHRESVIVYEAGRSNARVKRPGSLFVRSACAKLGQSLDVNWDEFAKQYANGMDSWPEGG